MSENNIKPTLPDSSITAQSGQTGLLIELGSILVDRFGFGKIIIFGEDSHTLVHSLQQDGLNALEPDEGEKAGGKLDLLVFLKSQTLPETALANLIHQTEAVLFIQDSQQMMGINSTDIGLDAWMDWFAQHGFMADLSFRPHLTDHHATFLIKSLTQSQARLAAQYEQLVWRLESETTRRRTLMAELHDELSVNGFDTAEIQVRLHEKFGQEKIDQLRREKDDLYRSYVEIYNSESWQMMRRLHRVRHWFIPPGSRRERQLKSFIGGLSAIRQEGFSAVLKRIYRQVSWRLRSRLQQKRFQSADYLDSQSFTVPSIEEHPLPGPHTAQIDVIICVHNALEDVKRCLQAVLIHSTHPYRLILVDDGSENQTRTFLEDFANQHDCSLLHNEIARGYTLAANQGMQASKGDFVVLLNSDTIVTAHWLDRLTACALSEDRIGIVGPLSNTASWQSIPKISEDGDWATNPLPTNMTVDEMGALVAAGSAHLYPEMKLLNGFCLFIRRAVLDQIGYFDDETFGPGYGEEDDFCLRARAAGWKLALADNTYIYHAQSKSYSTERRRQLYERAGEKLREKHGAEPIEASINYNQNDRVLHGIRARSQGWFARQELIAVAQQNYIGKRVLFLLPIMVAGGGGNVIISEALAMRRMGVDVRLFNLPEYRLAFEQSYPSLDFPVIYAERQELLSISGGFDAVIATINTSVSWLQELPKAWPQLRLAYYVQGFEPLMYQEGSPDYQTALQSYTLLPQLTLFSKTAWTRQQVQDHTGAVCRVIGPSINIDLFRPRPSIWRTQADQPIKIAAMVRAGSPYRSPYRTMEVLQKASWRYGPSIEVLLFGIDPGDPEFSKLPVEFTWRATGLLSPWQVARFMNEIDIFVDFSQHQAMGLSALEAMACGAAVIVPQNGGAVEFVQDSQNGLIVDTSSTAACWQALQQLIDDAPLRQRIRVQALQDVCQYHPEQAAFNILKILFDE